MMTVPTSALTEPLAMMAIALAANISSNSSIPSQKPLLARPKSASDCSVAIVARMLILVSETKL